MARQKTPVCELEWKPRNFVVLFAFLPVNCVLNHCIGKPLSVSRAAPAAFGDGIVAIAVGIDVAVVTVTTIDNVVVATSGIGIGPSDAGDCVIATGLGGGGRKCKDLGRIPFGAIRKGDGLEPLIGRRAKRALDKDRASITCTSCGFGNMDQQGRAISPLNQRYTPEVTGHPKTVAADLANNPQADENW